MLNKEQIAQYLSDLESEQVERTVSTTNVDKFAEAICSFSNDVGNTQAPGYLFIGVNDNGQLIGLRATDKLLKDLANIRSDGNILPQPIMSVYKESFPEGDVVIIEVKPAHFPPVRYKGKVWIRVGARKAVANESEERILIEKRSIQGATFDLRPCMEASISDLKVDLFNAFYLPRAIDKDVLQRDNRPIEKKLASLRFYDVKSHYPTNAGVLLLGSNPEYYFFGAYIQYARFGGKSVASKIVNEHKFTGDLVTVLSKLDTFIETTIEQKHPVFVSALREETKRSYPHLAIRELLMNAVMHRDYESNAPIKFYEFDDRIEVINPGGLYGNARPENFPNVNDYRNPILSESMKVLGYVNRFNRGIQSVQEELSENGNGSAVFDFDKMTVFGVTVHNAVVRFREQIKGDTDKVTDKVTDRVTDRVTDNQWKIIEIMELRATVSTVELSRSIGISTRKIKENIKKLKDMGYIERIGPPKGGHWKVLERS